jgi:hypothetical protein
MNNTLQGQLSELWQKVLAYLPSLLGGLLLLLLGWVIGWIVKRMIIQLLVILRFDRLFIRLRWRSSLSKADLRHALYNLVGNIAFAVVFLVFLNSVLTVLKLEALSKMIEQGVLFIPRLAVAAIIIGVGWLIAARAGSAVRHSLVAEGVPQGTLIARGVKFVLIVFFSAMALAELDIAKEIVLIGFGAAALTVAAGAVLFFDTARRTLKDAPSRNRIIKTPEETEVEKARNDAQPKA